MEIYLGLISALFLSMLMMPALIRFAGRLRLVDIPDARKSHQGAIPRVGGIAIAIGAVVPAIVWLPVEQPVAAYLVAALVIVTFGILDDRRGLDYRIKFLAQGAAAAIIVWSDVCIYHLPFSGLDAIPHYIAAPLTVIFLLAVTNAFNLLDGLDGLAAGCAIFSLAAIAALAFVVDGGASVALLAVGTIGAVLGFLRYNTHPAIVFMGDAGSQFLGFTIGVLAIMLMERTENAMSPAIPLLLLGLPILDTTMVMVLRIRDGRSPFSPDRNHIHHKLLSIGFLHHEAVAIIYAVQALLVSLAFTLRFESDWLVLAAYAGICGTCVGAYLVVRGSSWRPHRIDGSTPTGRLALEARWQQRVATMHRVAIRYIEWSVGAYFILAAMLSTNVTLDIAVVAIGVLGLAAAAAFWRGTWTLPALRLAIYVAAIIVSFLSVSSVHPEWLPVGRISLWLLTVAVAIGFVIYLTPREQFQVTTLDLLIALVAVGVLALPIPTVNRVMAGQLLLRILVLLYGCELLLSQRPSRYGTIAMAVSIALLALGTAYFIE